MTSLRAIMAATLLFLLLGGGDVFAQSDSEIEDAKEHFRVGAEHYAAGDYAKAIPEFMSGHTLAPNAMFIYNVSLCYERLGRLDDALDAALKAQDMGEMPAEVTSRNDARIHAIGLIMDAQSVASAIDERAPEVEQGPIVARDRESGGLSAVGWMGTALVVGGGVLVALGATTNGAIVDEIEAYEAAAARGDAAAFRASRDQIEADQATARLYYITGGGALAIGAALVLVDVLSGDESGVAAVISKTSGGALAGARLRF